MATAYSSNLALALPVTGELSGTWGTTVNTQITNMLNEALGYQAVSVTSLGPNTLTIPDGTTGVARSIFIQLNGTGGGTVEVPTAKTKMYFVFNNTASAITFKVTGQTGVSIPAAAKIALVSNGTDIIVAENYFSALTLGAALPVASGGTGITSFGTGVATALGVNTGTAGAFVVNGGALGSPLSVGTMPAFTLGGTVSGGGNNINNVVIGTSTPLAGAFTTVSATGDITQSNAAARIAFSSAAGNGGLQNDTASAYALLYGSTHATLAKNVVLNSDSGAVRIKSTGTDIGVFTSTGLAVTGALTASTSIATGTGNSTTAGLKLINGTAGFASGWGAIYAESLTPSNLNFALAARWDGQQTNINTATGGLIINSVNNSEVTRVSSTGLVVNEDSGDIDFRVESDNNTHALFVDAGNDQVVIGGSAPVTGSASNIPLSVKYGSGPAVRFYSNVSASMAATSGISLTTYGASKYSGYQTTSNGGGMWVNSSSGASTYVTGGTTSGIVYLGNFSQDPFENTSVAFVEYANFNTNEIVFNETSRDQDFRVESDGNTHALFVDAGNNAVAINSATVIAGAALNVYNGGILNFKDYTLSGTTLVPISQAMTGGLYVMRDDLNGGTCLVLYENSGTPIIVSQSGSNYTTGTPTGVQIKLSANASAGIAASMAAAQTTTLRVMALICDPN